MKKILLIVGIFVLITLGVGGGIYWYLQSNKVIDSFDDVCSEKDEYELECKGAIEQYNCENYRSTGTKYKDLNPFYPILICEKNGYKEDEGIYRKFGDISSRTNPTTTYYIIIKDNAFEFIQSEDQFRQLIQPIESVEEAKAYFNALNRGLLVLDEEKLSKIKFPKFLGGETDGDRFLISSDEIDLSQVTPTTDGYLITAYSGLPTTCVDEVYFYTFLLKRDGLLIEQDKELIWEMINKPACIY